MPAENVDQAEDQMPADEREGRGTEDLVWVDGCVFVSSYTDQ